jgi:hypothetical protein
LLDGLSGIFFAEGLDSKLSDLPARQSGDCGRPIGGRFIRHRLASPPHLTSLQADDIDAGRQQHGDARGYNDQEEFSHGRALLRT